MRPAAAAAVGAMLALTLAGCLGGNEAPAASSSSSSTRPPSTTGTTTAPPLPARPPSLDLLLDFELAPCRGVSLHAAQALADVQALLPEGFTAAPSPYVPGSSTGVLGVELFACANLTTPNLQVPHTHYGQVYTLVEPPTERVPAAPEAARHEYVFRVLAAEDVLAFVWPVAGYDTYNGSADVVVNSPVPDAPLDSGLRVGQAVLGSSDGYFLMAGGVANPVAPEAPGSSFVRYTVLADASVLMWTGRYDLARGVPAHGYAQVPSDDPFAAFQAPTGSLQGVAWLHEDGGMLEMDLRRIFPVATAVPVA